ncbi:secreted RxLR effector peptide protein, putative [Phytophthora infestans T30-4]|uniref:Secreted RxLR effector peptide protein, putative n=2 Tax=Phytophthora infestans TaxID=4787 RepID=D0P1W0_PHYIT|nr:secreted RxLR effector peptide protein, putative [Phytophthora infestans T30-4]EEY55093.1 secreted RxLR effector peptide protein, putative [Phytophthora infestans T30-4]KAF4036034.1 hypothetical protein GN244_ATG11942 [Phytophthora infestans]KAF4038424.1 hypothetical protein GN244_ATG09450 [Phytophthora infestans]KAF4147616.1 hypothetical protein GN958_ATG03189 [Phytophthora infestans]|eukprot:XP_002895723.1 secreted RxLR effector peptide protein, putative [Phytophthora infestans T30-4]
MYLGLTIVFILLVTTSTYGAASIGNSQTSSTPCCDKRLLSSFKPVVSQSSGNEERINNPIKTMEIRSWFMNGKTQDFVENSLKLKGLSGEAKRAHPNYKYYQKFLYDVEGRQLDQLYRRGIPMETLWKRLRLENVRLKELDKNNGFRIFVRFMERYDESNFVSMQRGVMKHVWTAYQHLPEGHKYAAAIVWGRAGRPRKYVKLALRMDTSANRNQFYQKFLQVSGKKDG